MELMRPAFTDHSFRRPPCARRDIGGRGGRAMGFTPENRFGAGSKRGFCWSQRRAGLAIQPMFGLGFRLRWSGSAVERLSVFGYGLAATARVLSVLARVLSVLARVLPVFGARFARIGARFVRIGARFARIGARFVRIGAHFVHEFRVIGADWGVWEASSARFRHSQTDGRLQL